MELFPITVWVKMSKLTLPDDCSPLVWTGLWQRSNFQDVRVWMIFCSFCDTSITPSSPRFKNYHWTLLSLHFLHLRHTCTFLATVEKFHKTVKIVPYSVPNMSNSFNLISPPQDHSQELDQTSVPVSEKTLDCTGVRVPNPSLTAILDYDGFDLMATNHQSHTNP